MQYYLNLESVFDSFRLKKDGLWRPYDNSEFVHPDDYSTTSPIEVLALQKRNENLNLNGTLYKVEPDSSSIVFNPLSLGRDTLYYRLYGYHQDYPMPPSRTQMDSVLAGGNDNLRNRLVLSIDGSFNLFSGKAIHIPSKNPEIVCRFNAFSPGCGYVGAETVAPKFKEQNDILFNQALSYWLEHLKSGVLDQHVDENDKPISNEEIFDAIYSIRENWTNLSNRWHARGRKN